MKNNHKLDQQGIISIITVAFIAGILLLITLGFMRVMLSNHRQSLDGQLNAQAFYAAESGVNDFLGKLDTHINTLSPNERDTFFSQNFGFDKPCNQLIDALNLDPVLEEDSPVKYTCLLAENRVKIIETSVQENHGKLYKLEIYDNEPAITNIRVEWGRSDETGVRLDSNLPPRSQWDQNIPAMLRVTLFGFPDNNMSRANLINYQRTYFLIPRFNVNNANNVNLETASLPDGSKFEVQCVNGEDFRCKVWINLPGGPFEGLGNTRGSMYVRILPIYKESSVNISVGNGASPVLKDLISAQYKIDATGRANDVYKRIRVSKDYRIDYNYPEYVTKGTLICKQYIFWSPDNAEDVSGECGID